MFSVLVNVNFGNGDTRRHWSNPGVPVQGLLMVPLNSSDTTAQTEPTEHQGIKGQSKVIGF